MVKKNILLFVLGAAPAFVIASEGKNGSQQPKKKYINSPPIVLKTITYQPSVAHKQLGPKQIFYLPNKTYSAQRELAQKKQLRS